MTTTLDTARVPESARTRVTVPAAARAAAALSFVAAGIHLWVVPAHLAQWWAFAAFFVAVAVGQLLTVPVVLRWPHPRLLLAGIAGNVGVVLVWVVSRTAGLPIGPPVLDMTGGRADPALGGYGAHAAHQVEAVGVLDFTSTVLELVVVVALVSLLPAAMRRRTVNALLLVGLALWGLYATGVLA